MCTIPSDGELDRVVENLLAVGRSDDMILSMVRLKLSRAKRAAAEAAARVEHEEVLASITERQWQAIHAEAAKRAGKAE